ncbi:MAG TPA: aldolase, partial [Candidatus Wirthbacteria bacterium]|nr:aldolase [Candidatus Wirthbacteria bacterium]
MSETELDDLVRQAVFGQQAEKNQAHLQIRKLAHQAGIYPASIHNLYQARAEEAVSLDWTAPAINIRCMTHDLAHLIFRVADKLEAGPVIFEIARSEIDYTRQSPQEFSSAILSAAIRAGRPGPVFIQGDHFQLKTAHELETIKDLVREAIEAGFYNIDIDASTLVDYEKESIADQQELNYKMTAILTNYIRSIEQEGITVSVGGEIGHIGGRNSTAEELTAFMDNYQQLLDPGVVGLSKISIQTGTHHGGVVLADGSLAEVAVDFGVLKELSKIGRKYGLGGTVQHGASTLPAGYFRQFPASEAIEIHLATGFQNIILD